MNKTMLAISALSATVAFQAVADGLASSDVVGYQKDGCEATTYKMYGVSFKAVGGDGKMTLNEVLKGDFTDGDSILIPDEAGVYSTYLYFGEATTSDPDEQEDNPEFLNGPGWYLAGVFKGDSVTLANGQSFWFYPKAKVDTTMSGAVPKDWSYTAPANVYSMIANPFPTEIKLKDFTYAGTNGDTILIPDASGVYVTYLYFDEATTSDPDEQEDNPEFLSGAGWYCSGVYSGNVTVPANQGFWLLPKAQVTISATLAL